MSSMIYPPGFKPGCNPRVSTPGHFFPMASERVTIIDRKDWPKYAGKVSLVPFVKKILNQGNVGSCATEATAQAVMIAEAFAGMPFTLLNPWFIYYHTSGGRDTGSSIDENLKFAMEYGIASEAVWPRSMGWQRKPSKEAYEDAKKHRIHEAFDVSSVEEMVSCEFDAYAIVHGAKGHAIIDVEHGETAPKIANSWDVTWGEKGFGKWCRYDQINWSYGSFAVRVGTIGGI